MNEGNQTLQTTGTIESLQAILVQHYSRPVTQDEALEVGDLLLSFFELLAQENEPSDE
jgi:hypothetical protein